MDYFQYKNQKLHAENVAVEAIAAEVGTPFYCYSKATLLRHYQVFDEALKGLKHRVFFAVKSNSNPAVLQVLSKAGAGMDVVSAGEIRHAFMAGVRPADIVFSGVGKTEEEMRFALEHGIFQFNVESLSELELLSQVAASMKKIAPVAFRVNPDVDPKTHKKISTGKKESKFGITLGEARRILSHIEDFPAIKVQGVSVHIGSQLTSLEPFEQAFRAVRAFVEELRSAGHAIATIDLGGGLGIPYTQGGEPPLPAQYGALVKEVFAGMEGTFLFEPGRMIAGNAGILVSKVIYTKQAPARKFVIIDAAMNDLIRPTLYEAHHDIIPVAQDGARAIVTADVVGPVCETGDVFAFDRAMEEVNPGELVAFRTAGAYGAVMSSTYNARLSVPEVLVDGDRYHVIRPRPTYEEMLGAFRMPE